MAQRMESVAPPGGVMLSASTARLVDGAAALGEPELVQIKGADEPVAAQPLLGMERTASPIGRAESNLVGRQWEMSAVEGLLDRAIDGHGAVVGVVGPPGIGKSRLVREVAAMAVAVAWRCSPPTASRTPARSPSMRSRGCCARPPASMVLTHRPPAIECATGFPTQTPRIWCCLMTCWASPTLNAPLPAIDPDARRRRLTALVNAASLARETPAVYVIEDAHWIDEVSESMLAEFFTVIPQTPSMVLITYRPEYRGALTRVRCAIHSPCATE